MSDRADSSFFAAVRSVVCFIVADGKYDPKEREWFMTLVDGYGISRSERKQLEADFDHPLKLEDLWNEIHRAEDRDRLLRWARGVTAVDGNFAVKEKELLSLLESLNARKSEMSLQESYRELAGAVLEFEKENRLWNDLRDFGQILNRRYRRWMGFDGIPLYISYPEGPLKIKGSMDRPIYWMLLVVAIFAIAVVVVPRCVSGH